MSSDRPELPRGALELLVLKALSRTARHGYALARWIEERSDGALLVEEGSLYPALHRLERRGLIEAEWGKTDTGRRAKFYSLTDGGRESLRERTALWNRLSLGVAKVLRSRGAGGTA
ncbi:MAG: PadR family transcriptional regulator [Planctomycetota bacterium]